MTSQEARAIALKQAVQQHNYRTGGGNVDTAVLKTAQRFLHFINTGQAVMDVPVSLTPQDAVPPTRVDL